MLTRPEWAHQNVFRLRRRLKPKIDKMMNISAAYIIRTFESAVLEMQIFLDDQNVFEADNDVL